MSRKLQDTMAPFALHKELRKRFPRLFNPGRIYHYTSKEVLLELTKGDAKLFATYFRALNDDQEYVKGFTYVVKKYLPKKNRKILKLLEPYIAENDKWMGSEKPNCPVLMPWVMSFSREKDSLYQWRSYVDPADGGFAIGFDFEELEKLVRISAQARRSRGKSDASALSYELHFLPCLYLDENDGADVKQANRLLDFLFKEWYVRRKKDAGFTKNEEFAILALVITNLFALITKDASFRNENEVRLVMFLKGDEYFKNITFIGGKPRIEIPLCRETGKKINELIKEVVISPHGDRCLLRTIADMSALKNQIKYAIKTSNSPFNGR